MTSEFSKQDIEDVKDSLFSIRERLSDKFLKENCSLVEEQLYGYEGCCRYKQTNSEQDINSSYEEADKALLEALKQLGIKFNN